MGVPYILVYPRIEYVGPGYRFYFLFGPGDGFLASKVFPFPPLRSVKLVHPGCGFWGHNFLSECDSLILCLPVGLHGIGWEERIPILPAEFGTQGLSFPELF